MEEGVKKFKTDQTFYYAVFSKGIENTNDTDMTFNKDQLKYLFDLGLLLCSRFEIQADGLKRRDICVNDENKESISLLEKCILKTMHIPLTFDGLLFKCKHPFSIDAIFRHLQTIKYTSAKNYHSDAYFNMYDEDDDTCVEYLSIYMNEENGDDAE